jgi:hypothetical protein
LRVTMSNLEAYVHLQNGDLIFFFFCCLVIWGSLSSEEHETHSIVSYILPLRTRLTNVQEKELKKKIQAICPEIYKTYIGETHYKPWLDFSQHASIPRHHPLYVMSPSTIRHVIIHQITNLCLQLIFLAYNMYITPQNSCWRF